MADDETKAADEAKAKSEKPKKKKISRRKFILRSLGGGTAVLLGAGYLGRNAIRRQIYSAELPASFDGNTDDPLMWFEIDQENRVRLYSPKVEMGQGTHTSLAQIAADELEVEVDQIDVLHAPSNRGNIDQMSTGGSLSIAGLWMPLRELAATMREMLRNHAAKAMGVAASELTIEAGVVSGGGESMSYGAIVAATDEWEVPDTPELKDVGSYRFVGQGVPRVDLAAKVFGEPIFGMDATMEGMLYASVVRPEQIGAVLKGADTRAAEAMPGVVKVVVEEDFVGVIAESRMQAERAKQAVRAEWQVDHVWQTAHVDEMIQVGKGTPMEVQLEGDAEGTLAAAEGSERYHSAEYRSPIGAHAQLEPNGAVVMVEDDGTVRIKMSTQVVRITRDEVAARMGVEPEQVIIEPTYLGGGFGRRLHTPNAIQAAILSKAVGKPVKCFFTREEEFRRDTFRPPTHHKIAATLGADGRIEAMEHHVSSGDVMFGSPLFPPAMGSILGADIAAFRGGLIQYRTIPNLRAVSWRVRLPFTTSWWRSLGLLANTFAIESFIDELAHESGQDPIELRLKHLPGDEGGRRLRSVIEAATERAGYRDEAADGRAMGFACCVDSGTPAAHVAEVSLTDGKLRVEKVTCAMDPGLSVNPDQVTAQCEGAIMMGLSAAMFEQMTIEDGRLEPTIYGPYRMAMMSDTPKEVEVVLLDGTGVPGPVGEPPLGPIGAAVANAIFRLTGERLRSMPLVGAGANA